MDDKNKDYSEAYEADRKLRAVREEELQAAKDYLGVLLGEMETKNRELEETKRDNERLKKEAAALVQEQKKQRGMVFWMIMSIFEAVVVVVLLVVMLRNIRADNTSVVQPLATPTPQVVQQGEDGTEPDEYKLPHYSESLNALAEQFNSTSQSEYKAAVIEKNGFEYLSFINGDISVSYRNEYEDETDAFKKSIIIENSAKRLELVYNGYEFENGIEQLCPSVVGINGSRTLVFMSGMQDAGDMPSEILFVDEQTLKEYELYDFAGELEKQLQLEYLTERSRLEEAPVQFTVTVGDKLYNYAVSETTYTTLDYNDESKPVLTEDFILSIEENAIAFDTLVMLSDHIYLGRLSGKLTVLEGELAFTQVRFAAIVPANQDDEDNLGLIIPAQELSAEYVRVGSLTGLTYLVPINENIARMPYNLENLDTQDPNNWLYYDADGAVASVKGIDVSRYQGDIDWEKVKADGVEFAIIRLGFRGMNEGTLEIDPYYEQNMREALAAGVRVGVYFFSQAITQEEAVAEAEFVLEHIKDYDVTYPVAFDTEYVVSSTGFEARANGLSYAQRTDMCIAFCERIKEAGYVPMIYANTRYMITGIDLERLAGYDKWFAYYGSQITFPYSFDMMQYTESGKVAGIDSAVDINICFKRY